jgi:CubicO group peptidase (beta-lactamase class C family)
MNSEDILQTEIHGVRIHGKNDDVSPENYFHIGSCSKSVLAVIAAKLIEENKIDWDTRFFDIYPELKEKALIDYHSITLEDLFLCKAGIKGFTTPEDLFPELNSKSDRLRYDFAEWLVQQKPGSKLADGKFEFNYSNAGYTMASLMLEKVSGKTYEELIQLYVVDEMGIDTYIGFPNRLDTEQPWGHILSKNDVELFSPEHEYRIPQLITPAGDLCMKPKGFAKYIRLSLKGLRGNDNFITSENYQYIHFSHPGFSIGVFNSKMSGIKFSGMDGSAGTFFCRAILIPESDFAFTIMTNAGSGSSEMKAVDFVTMKIVKKHYNWWWKFWM